MTSSARSCRRKIRSTTPKSFARVAAYRRSKATSSPFATAAISQTSSAGVSIQCPQNSRCPIALVDRRGMLKRFPAKWIPVRVKKTRQTKNIEHRSDSIGTERALDLSHHSLRRTAPPRRRWPACGHQNKIRTSRPGSSMVEAASGRKRVRRSLRCERASVRCCQDRPARGRFLRRVRAPGRARRATRLS